MSQPPDLGRAFSMFGNIANNAKGSPSATPNPAIPEVNCQAPPSEDREPASKDPRIGPVHEKDTIDKVNAIKKTPRIPPIPSPLVVELVHAAGNANSKYPKNEKAKTIKMIKKMTFNHTLVEISFKISGLTESNK